MLKDYVTLMRPRHYIKNILVLPPFFFMLEFTDPEKLLIAFTGFVIFCLLSSIVYIINDIFDVEKDRQHEVKKFRPIAAGRISIRKAWIFAGVLSAGVFLLGVNSRQRIIAWLWLASYLLLNILYSKWLKSLPIFDVFSLAAFYLIRLLYGCALDGIPSSFYLCMTVLSVSLFMGLGKRRNEFTKNDTNGGVIQQTRPVLAFYNQEFLDKNMYVTMAMGIMFYALWCNAASTIERLQTTSLMWTVPIVIFIFMRYSLLVERGGYGDPVDVLYHDKVLKITAVLYFIIIIMIVYGNQIF